MGAEFGLAGWMCRGVSFLQTVLIAFFRYRLYMRRTPYNDRFDRSYLKAGRPRNSDPQASFRVESSRLPEDNFIAPRTPVNYNHSRPTRPYVHRPLTTQKTSGVLDHKSNSARIKGRAASRWVSWSREICTSHRKENNSAAIT